MSLYDQIIQGAERINHSSSTFPSSISGGMSLDNAAKFVAEAMGKNAKLDIPQKNYFVSDYKPPALDPSFSALKMSSLKRGELDAMDNKPSAPSFSFRDLSNQLKPQRAAAAQSDKLKTLDNNIVDLSLGAPLTSLKESPTLTALKTIKGNVQSSQDVADKTYMLQPAKLSPSEIQARDLKAKRDSADWSTKDHFQQQYDALTNSDQYINDNIPQWAKLATDEGKWSDDEMQQAKDARDAISGAMTALSQKMGFGSTPEESAAYKQYSNLYDDYLTVYTALDGRIRTGKALMSNVANALTYGGYNKLADNSVRGMAAGSSNPDIKQALSNPQYSFSQSIATQHPVASTVGNIVGSLAPMLVGGEVLDGVAAALPRVAKFLTPAVKSGIIFASQTAADDLVAGKPAGDVALDTITSAAGGYFGSAVAGLITKGALRSFEALGMTPTTLQRVILAGEGGLAFGATSTALEEAKNAAMQGKKYKLDIGGAVTNLVTTTLFGALGEFKGNPKAADIQERLNSTDPIAAARAQNDAAIFLNASEPSENIKTDTSSTANLASPKDTAKAETQTVVQQIRINIPNMETLEPVARLTGSEFARNETKKLSEQVIDFFKSLGNKVSRAGFGDVAIDAESVGSDIGYGMERAKAIAFAAVPDVIRNGQQIDFQQNWKGRGVDSYIFSAPIEIDGKRSYVGAIVLSDSQKYFYLHEVVDGEGNIIYIKNDATGTVKTGVTVQDGLTSSPVALSIDTAIPQNYNSINQQGTTSQPRNVSNDTRETARAYIQQWPGTTVQEKPAGIEPSLASADNKGYNGNWDKIYADAVNGAGDDLSCPVEITPPSNATLEQIAQTKAYIEGSNQALQAGKLSPTGRVSTKGTLRDQASRAADRERSRALAAGTPYMGQIGHVPDTTWTGTTEPFSWMDLDPSVNMSIGGQANRYPKGYKPTEFCFRDR